MLTWLGLCTIGAVLALILLRITSVLPALVLVPLGAAIAGGFGAEAGTFAVQGISSVTPVAVLLAFAVVYFGVMNDAGLFAPAIRAVTQVVGRDPVRIAVGTALVAALTHLDGGGATTFMVTVPAMLPLYRAAGMDPLVLTATVALAAGTMNMLPWGGPAVRAAAALQVPVDELFVPLLPALFTGMAGVLACAVLLGRRERRRLAGRDSGAAAAPGALAVDRPAGPRGWATGRRWGFNAALTAATIASLFTGLLPLPLVFMVASAIALLVNYPDPQVQRERLVAHGSAAMMMVTILFGAGVFTGILTQSGMLTSMAHDLVRTVPEGVLGHAPVAMAVASMPLSLVFDPDSFYFGLMPVLANASAAGGGSAIEVGRAALLGHMTTGFPVSPLTPSTFLLVGLAGVDLADHQRRTIPYAFGITLVMAAAAVATRAIAL